MTRMITAIISKLISIRCPLYEAIKCLRFVVRNLSFAESCHERYTINEHCPRVVVIALMLPAGDSFLNSLCVHGYSFIRSTIASSLDSK
jgi:hypothetical protein